MKYIGVLFLVLLIGLTRLYSQVTMKPDYAAYVALYKDIAIQEMKIFRIPASITLAQGIIESNCGLSPLATEANNHFGIKCHKEWTGEKYFYDDDAKRECFRKYPNALDSYRDHSLFLANRSRYAALFSLDPDDYTGWAMGLKQAGYATNPEYPAILIRVIETNKLYLFDDTLYHDQRDETVADIKLPPIETMKETTPGKINSPRYWKPNPDQFEVINYSQKGRKVYENNGLPFIVVERGDTWYSIAREFAIFAFQVYKDNDLDESDILAEGQALYLEPKKKQCFQKVHLVKKAESLYQISQQYGIKLKFLYKYNGLKEGEEPAAGTTIKLHR